MKYYVIAGTRAEYNEFIVTKAKELFGMGQDISLSHFVYVSTEDTLQGVQEPTGWLYGSWRERADIKTLLPFLISRKRGGVSAALVKILVDL